METTTKYLQLWDLIPDKAFQDPRYCSTKYWEWEDQVATKELEKKGWNVGPWFTGEKDSFGPLSRCVEATVRNQTFIIIYG